MRDDISEATWKEVSDWLRDRGLVLSLVLEQGAYVAHIARRALHEDSFDRYWLATGDSPGPALARVLKRCREDGGDVLLIDRGVVREAAAR